MFVYRITNSINGKFYVGKTSKTIHERFQQHCKNAKSKNASKMLIVSAMRKYGIENFTIECIYEASCESELNAKEIEFISALNPEYNIAPGGEGGCTKKGWKHSEESKMKMSQHRTGFKDSEETKRKKSESRLKWKHTKESISKWVTKQTLVWLVISPNNSVVKIDNMKEYCTLNNLKYNQMLLVCRGKQANHKGYRVAIWA